MTEPTHIERLRAIRDQIGQELQRTPWEQWERTAREEVRRHPKLARLLDEADRAVSVAASMPLPPG